MSIKVLLAGDDRILLDGLCCLLARHDDIEVAGAAADGQAVAARCRELRPDIVLLDAGIGGASGAEITQQVRAETPSVKVIAHSAPPGRGVLAAILRAGASGYLDRGSGEDELINALRAVSAGRPYLGGLAPDNAIGEFTEPPPKPQAAPERSRRPPKLLTAREIQVLRLLASGMRVKEIARVLNISVKTVESHRQNMMDKLEIHNAIELARYALREGLASV
jgi:DNA-binding NarL/FixJ family response regulator